MYAIIILSIVSSRGFAASNDKADVFVKCASDNSTYTCMLDGTCVPMQLHCDGKQDCEDGSDEGFCPISCVGEEWFQCKNGHCISTHWVCDKEDDCMDWSDEVDCKDDSGTVAKPDDDAAEKPEVICPGTDFKCRDSLCIPVSWTCDDEEDCRHGDDEDSKLCGKEQGCDGFACGDDSCIPDRWVCDGEPDCTGGLDEVDCAKERNGTEACRLEEGRFPCQDGSRCLLSEHVCDNIQQCGDGSDEASFCTEKPNCTTLSCSHKCIPTPEGPVCYCPEGYQLDQKNKTTCVDVDECQVFGSCSQTCHNEEGSFTCSCEEGYILRNNSCVAGVGEPFMFFATKNEVRGLKVNSMQYFPVATNLPHVIGIGFDSLGGRVYCADPDTRRPLAAPYQYLGNALEHAAICNYSAVFE